MNKYFFAALGAGISWGAVGIFTRSLEAMGISSSAAVLIQSGISAFCFLLLNLVKNPLKLKLRLSDLWIFVGAGVASQFLSTYTYFKAINLTSLAYASILMNTAPAIVMVLSVLLFKEKISIRKIAALLLSFLGCCFVAGIKQGGTITGAGFAYGLAGGITYAMFSIFVRIAMNRGYSGETINFYACMMTALCAATVFGTESVAIMFSSAGNFAVCVIFGVITSFCSYGLFSYALKGLETSKVSIIVSVEMVVAALAGVVLFKESVSASCMIGMISIISAIAIMNIPENKKRRCNILR